MNDKVNRPSRALEEMRKRNDPDPSKTLVASDKWGNLHTSPAIPTKDGLTPEILSVDMETLERRTQAYIAANVSHMVFNGEGVVSSGFDGPGPQRIHSGLHDYQQGAIDIYKQAATDMLAVEAKPRVCDCERSANGIGIAGRECDCPSAAGEDEDDPQDVLRIGPNPLTHNRVRELLDYADAYGEYNEDTPNGTTSKLASPMNDERRGAIRAFKQVLDIEGVKASGHDTGTASNQFHDPEGQRGGAMVFIPMHVLYKMLRGKLQYLDGAVGFDRDAFCQQFCVAIEKQQGSYPNLPGYEKEPRE